jgi:hypothetical protein
VPITGACCYTDGTCAVVNSRFCPGTFTAQGVTCTAAMCAQPMGACCMTDGSCTVMLQTACTGTGRTYRGNSTECLPNNCPQPPTGACCLANGSCSLVTQAACTTATGTYRGNATVCSPNPCPQPMGVCCRGAGCAISTSAGCTGPGTFFSAATTPMCNTGANTSTPCCYADFNKVNGVNVDDAFEYLDAWFHANPNTKFGTVPGTPTLDDVFLYLQAWFNGCT